MREAVVSDAAETMTGGTTTDSQEEQQQLQEEEEGQGPPTTDQLAQHQEGLPPTPVNGLGDSSRRQLGKCKWFNVLKGFGFITPHDGSQDIFVHQSVIQMSGFRSLGEGEEVEYECKPSDKGIEATFVSGPQSSDCKGSDRRPMGKKKYKKIRCYNCGDFGNHIAAKCPHGPLPKRCHFCKAEDHLIADCPSRDHIKSQRDSDSGADTPGGSSNSFNSGGEGGTGSPEDESGTGNGTGGGNDPAASAETTTTGAETDKGCGS